MSAVIKTVTPFVIESVLFSALEKAGVDPDKITLENQQRVRIQNNKIQLGDIVINRSDHNGRQLFRQLRGRWVLMHDSDEYVPVSRFLAELSLEYELAYQYHLDSLAEEERLRLEEERKTRVEMMRQQAIIKAKAQGYSVKESRTVMGQIQLVLTRTV